MWKVAYKQKVDKEWVTDYFGKQNEAVLFFESMSSDPEMVCKNPEFEEVESCEDCLLSERTYSWSPVNWRQW